MEQELERARESFDNGVDGVAAYDENLCIQDWGGTMAALSGIPTAQAMGKPLAELVPGLFGGDQSEAAASLEWVIRPVTRQGRFLGGVLVARATTAAELARANEDMVRLLHAASHDLREPLRAMISFAEILERRAADKLGPAEVGFLGRIRRGGLRMRDLVSGLGDFAAAHKMVERQRVDLHSLVAEALKDLQFRIDEVEAVIDVGELPSVTANRRGLMCVVKNLLSNALKFRDGDHVRITVGAQRHGDELRVWVEDDGIGFEPEDAERIFEMFARLHPKDRYEGSGVGLALVRHVIKGHGGRAWAESTPGKGSRFTFTLPAA